MEHKYVRHSEIGFVVWPTTDALWHSHVGRLLRTAGGKLLSAGFCRIHPEGAECYGMSESLGMSSIPGDSEALTKQLGITP